MRSEAEEHPTKITWSGMTHPGKARANNEDAFLALTFDAQELRYLGKTGDSTLHNADFVFAVSDGSFGMAAQGLASGFGDVLTELFNQVHRDLLKLGQSYSECEGMGATLTLAWFMPGWVYFAHIGDSRLYYLPAKGEMQQVSADDSYVGWLRRNGKLNEREQRFHPRKNILSKALGAGHQFVDPQIGAVGCNEGDRFLLCTDGVIDGLWDAALERLIREPDATPENEAPAKTIVEAAVDASGRDNATAIVVSLS